MAFGERRVARRATGACGLRIAVVLLLATALGLASAAPSAAIYLPYGERYMPQGIAIDPRTGVIYSGTSDGSICRVYSVNATGIPQVLAGTGRCETSGDGGPAIEADVNPPQHLAVDGSGNVFTGSGYAVRRISQSTGTITAWAGDEELRCHLWTWDGPNPRVGAVASEVGISAGGLAIDPVSGHLFVSDACNYGIWEIDDSGVIVAGYVGVGTAHWSLGDIAFDLEGNLYFEEGRYGERVFKMDTRGTISHIAGNGETEDEGDGGPATSAGIDIAKRLAVDSSGVLYIATSNDLIRTVDAEGTIEHLTGQPWPQGNHPAYPGASASTGAFWGIHDIAIDAEDNLYVSDWGDKTLLTLQAPVEPESTIGWIMHERVHTILFERTGGGNPSTHDCDQGCYGDPVNTASGEYWERQVDLAIPGRGPALSFERTYSAQSTRTGPLGRGWTGSYFMELDDEGPGGMVEIRQENGSIIAFEPSGEGDYAGPSAYLATLEANRDGTWTLTRRQRDRFTFDEDGRLIEQRDLDDETTTLRYDEADRLTTITDPAGRTIRLEYDEADRVDQLGDSAGRTVRYGYTNGNLTIVVDARGETWRYAYDEQHRLTRRTDPNGHLDVENDYDAADRVVTQTDAEEGVTRFVYSPGMTQITSPEGRVRQDWYAGGQLLKRIDGAGTAEAATWEYEYDPTIRGTTQVTDPNGHAWRATYNAAGRRTSTTDPLSHTTRATYDSLGDMLTFVDGTNVTTTMTYDEGGNLLTRSTPLTGTEQTQVTRYVHGDEAHPGDITEIVDPREETTELDYDRYGNLTSVTDPLGNETTMAYDAAGNLETVVSPRGNEEGGRPEAHTTTYAHDDAGLLTQVTDPLGGVWRWSYDAAGNLRSETDAEEHVTSYGYDDADLLTTITRADETTLRRGYDADGNLTSATDGASNATTYAYDALDRVANVTDPLRRVTSYDYDDAGNLTSLVDAMERTTTYGYDDANRLTSIDYSDEATPDVTFGYDNANRRTSMRDGSGTSSYTWDSLQRLTQHTDGGGSTVRYGYDIAGNLTRLTYPSSDVVTYTYDDAGRMASVADWLEGTTSFGYDADSNLVRTTFPEASGNVDTFAYDAAGRMSDSTFAQGETTLADFSYTRDANGLMTYYVNPVYPAHRASSSYTALNQLASQGADTFAYDAADNMTEIGGAEPLTYDAAGQLREGPVAPGSAEAPTTFAYDANGNRTSATPEGGSATRYEYDQANRLVSHVSPTSRKRTYGYDGDGLRVSKTLFTTVTRFAWDRSGGLSLLLSDGTNRYLYGPGGTPFAQVDEAEAITYLHRDQLGSTRMLTDAEGAVSATFRYDPYGEPAFSTGTAQTPFGFAGEYRDAESGLIYLRARFMDPATGQFLTRDPLEDVSGEPYAYAGSSPLAYTDPTGLLWDELGNAGMFISNAAAGTLNELTFGLSNKIAGVDGTCAGPGYGFGTGLGFAASLPLGVGMAKIPRANSAFGKLIRSFKAREKGWARGPAHIEPAEARRYRGGISIEEVFERGDDVLFRHRVYGPDSDVGHETFRQHGKFGAP